MRSRKDAHLTTTGFRARSSREDADADADDGRLNAELAKTAEKYGVTLHSFDEQRNDEAHEAHERHERREKARATGPRSGPTKREERRKYKPELRTFAFATLFPFRTAAGWAGRCRAVRVSAAVARSRLCVLCGLCVQNVVFVFVFFVFFVVFVIFVVSS